MAFDPQMLASMLMQHQQQPQQSAQSFDPMQGGAPKGLGGLPLPLPPLNPLSNPLGALTGGLSGLFGK